MKIVINTKRLFVILFSVSVCTNIMAQDAYNSEKSAITKVKRSPDLYIYAEATCKTKEEAMAVAEEMFYQNVNEYVAEQKKLRNSNEIVLKDPKSMMNEISMPRGSNMYRCFYYTKKKDIFGTESTIVMTKDTESSIEKIPAEDAAEILAEAPTSAIAPTFPTAAVTLAGIKSVKELNSALARMKQDGTVTGFGKYKDITDKAAWYFVLYDANGNINAMLSDGDVRYNVATGNEDSFANYPQNAAYGIKFKK